MIFGLEIPIYADECDRSDYVNVIETIKDEFEESGTSLDEILNKQLIVYKTELKDKNLSLDDKAKIMNLISALSEMIDSYETKTNTELYNLNLLNASYDLCESAVTHIYGWFMFKGYVLAGELLLHAKDNSTLNSTYSPYQGYRAKQSTLYSSLANSGTSSGSSSFPNSGSTVDKDCYYAIHSFNWNQTSTKFYISDYYDFDEASYAEGIEGAAVGMMYQAQNYGIITPYYVNIKLTK